MKAYEIKSIPTHYVIDAKGLYAGDDWSGLLKDCDMPPAADYSKKFDKALAALKSNDFKACQAELAKLSKEQGKDADNAQALEKWIDAHGTKAIADGDAAKEKGDIFGARDAYTDVTKRWGPKSDCVKSAKDKLADLQKDKDAKKALGQEKVWAQAIAAEESGDKATAAALYEKCAKAASGTKFADFCEGKVKVLK